MFPAGSEQTRFGAAAAESERRRQLHQVSRGEAGALDRAAGRGGRPPRRGAGLGANQPRLGTLHFTACGQTSHCEHAWPETDRRGCKRLACRRSGLILLAHAEGGAHAAARRAGCPDAGVHPLLACPVGIVKWACLPICSPLHLPLFTLAVTPSSTASQCPCCAWENSPARCWRRIAPLTQGARQQTAWDAKCRCWWVTCLRVECDLVSLTSSINPQDLFVFCMVKGSTTQWRHLAEQPPGQHVDEDCTCSSADVAPTNPWI